MKYLLKIFAINFLFIFIFIGIIEFVFGDWLKSNNFGYAIREHRNINIPMSVKFDGKKYDYFFKRNSLGFIGGEINPEEIKIIFLGGSTGEEMFKPYQHSLVGKLNEKLFKDKFKYLIVNASKGGKSTRGYVNDFAYWFSRIEKFNPKVFIFYIGINDSMLNLPGHFDEIEKKNLFEKIEDYLKNNSIFYRLKKKIEIKYFSKIRKYYGLRDESLYKNFKLINYEDAKKKYTKNKLDKNNKIILKNFKKNLENLKKIINDKNINPIFITQIKYNGLEDKNLFLINEYLKEFCKTNNYDVIKLDEMNYNLDEKDFYDNVHTTIKGSEKISNLLYPKLKKYLEKNINHKKQKN